MAMTKKFQAPKDFASVLSRLVLVPKAEIDAEEKKYKAAQKRAKKTVKASQRKA
jgi:hypothetical protein